MGHYDAIEAVAKRGLASLGSEGRVVARAEVPQRPPAPEPAPEPRDLDLSGLEALSTYCAPCPLPTRPVEGREAELDQIGCAMARPEVSNVVLLGQAGTGKSTLVYEAAKRDTESVWLEVDVARLCSGLANTDEMGARLKDLFAQARALGEAQGCPVVLFIDEFHQLVSISYGAVEALKPLLARSNAYGVHVVAATTYEEFAQYVSPNQALVERLERVSVAEVSHDAAVAIVETFLDRYLDPGCAVEPGFAEAVVDVTDAYMPANAQPRKAIQVVDACIGAHRHSGDPVGKALLAIVMERLCGARIETSFDAAQIRDYLDSRVFSQTHATAMVAAQLQKSAAGFCDPGRPKASFLFSGSTGTGKTELAKAMATSLFGAESAMVRFDMSEYADEAAADRFREALCQAVWARPFSVVLLDEIEKASGPAVRMLLQVLDDARLSDRNGRETSFSSCYIVATTNAAADIYADVAKYDADASGRLLAKLEPLIRDRLVKSGGGRTFSPEFLGRISCMVPFQPLSQETSMRIVRREVDRVCEKAERLHGVRVHIDERLYDFFKSDRLPQGGASQDSNAGGARRVKGLVEREVEIPVAAFVNVHPEARSVVVTVSGTLLDEQDAATAAANFELSIESTAEVVVEDASWR